MTNPIDPTPESNESAAHYRVSAQELAHVVNIIQARKEAEARQRANTVALGEAVEQLGLEMTPDELLAEIQADRARRSRSSRPRRQNSTQRRTFVTFAVCAGLAGMMVSSMRMHNLHREMWESRNNPLFMPREFAAETMPAPDSPATEAAQTMDTSLPVVVGTQFRNFAQFEENETAYCDFDTLRALARGRSQKDVLVQANGMGDEKLWMLEKQNGQVMVLVFATADEISRAMNGHSGHVYASMQHGGQPQLLPLRLFKDAAILDLPGQFGARLNVGLSEAEAQQVFINGPVYDSEYRGYSAGTEIVTHTR